MKNFAFLLIICGFSFSCAFKRTVKNEKVSLVQPISGNTRSLKDSIPDPIIPREAEPLTKCESLRKQALALKGQGATTIYVPQCKSDGSFESKQCDGSTGYCWCVDKNGNEILGTLTPPGHNPPLECSQESQEKRKAAAGQTKLTKSGKMRSLFLLERKDNILDSIIPREAETKCEQERAEALAKIKEGFQFVRVPDCRADGSFNPVQCDNRFSVNFATCWCVDQNGVKIPGTEVTVGVGLQTKPPVCSDKK